jgi:hypothetical protein
MQLIQDSNISLRLKKIHKKKKERKENRKKEKGNLMEKSSDNEKIMIYTNIRVLINYSLHKNHKLFT